MEFTTVRDRLRYKRRLIDKYYQGILTPLEQKNFDKYIKNDKGFRDRVLGEINSLDGISRELERSSSKYFKIRSLVLFALFVLISILFRDKIINIFSKKTPVKTQQVYALVDSNSEILSHPEANELRNFNNKKRKDNKTIQPKNLAALETPSEKTNSTTLSISTKISAETFLPSINSIDSSAKTSLTPKIDSTHESRQFTRIEIEPQIDTFNTTNGSSLSEFKVMGLEINNHSEAFFPSFDSLNFLAPLDFSSLKDQFATNKKKLNRRLTKTETVDIDIIHFNSNGSLAKKTTLLLNEVFDSFLRPGLSQPLLPSNKSILASRAASLKEATQNSLKESYKTKLNRSAKKIETYIKVDNGFIFYIYTLYANDYRHIFTDTIFYKKDNDINQLLSSCYNYLNRESEQSRLIKNNSVFEKVRGARNKHLQVALADCYKRGDKLNCSLELDAKERWSAVNFRINTKDLFIKNNYTGAIYQPARIASLDKMTPDGEYFSQVIGGESINIILEFNNIKETKDRFDLSGQISTNSGPINPDTRKTLKINFKDIQVRNINKRD